LLHVADNDLAVGRLIEALSASPFCWRPWCSRSKTIPQDGWDRVDGHRTVFLVASPWAKRGVVVKDFDNQNSALRTIRRILGARAAHDRDGVGSAHDRMLHGDARRDAVRCDSRAHSARRAERAEGEGASIP
jgi:hypothetical protein